MLYWYRCFNIPVKTAYLCNISKDVEEKFDTSNYEDIEKSFNERLVWRWNNKRIVWIIMIQKKVLWKKEKAILNASKTENEIKDLQDDKYYVEDMEKKYSKFFVMIRHCIKLQQRFEDMEKKYSKFFVMIRHCIKLQQRFKIKTHDISSTKVNKM